MKKLNLGCGTDIKKDFINVDYMEGKGVDLVHDLNSYPYPFKDSSMKEIFAQDIMEHLDNPNDFIRELWRIGANGCKIYIRVPHFSSVYAWSDMTHKRPFGRMSFNHYDVKKQECTSLNSISDVKFKVNSYINFGILKYLGFRWIFNKMSFIYERYLSFIFPAGDISFELEVIKN